MHAPVLARDLLPALRRPLDGGRTWRGRRVLGDNKTWRGALFMTAGTFGAAVALHRRARYRRRLPAPLQTAHPAAFGAAIAAGVVGGELPNSFLKRRLDLAPGTQRGGATGAALTVLDQGDLVLGIWAALTPLWRMPPRDALDAFVLVSAIHAAVNVIGYRLGARSAPV